MLQKLGKVYFVFVNYLSVALKFLTIGQVSFFHWIFSYTVMNSETHDIQQFPRLAFRVLSQYTQILYKIKLLDPFDMLPPCSTGFLFSLSSRREHIIAVTIYVVNRDCSCFSKRTDISYHLR